MLPDTTKEPAGMTTPINAKHISTASPSPTQGLLMCCNACVSSFSFNSGKKRLHFWCVLGCDSGKKVQPLNHNVASNRACFVNFISVQVLLVMHLIRQLKALLTPSTLGTFGRSFGPMIKTF